MIEASVFSYVGSAAGAMLCFRFYQLERKVKAHFLVCHDTLRRSISEDLDFSLAIAVSLASSLSSLLQNSKSLAASTKTQAKVVINRCLAETNALHRENKALPAVHSQTTLAAMLKILEAQQAIFAKVGTIKSRLLDLSVSIEQSRAVSIGAENYFEQFGVTKQGFEGYDFPASNTAH